jgi:hypothetical protein
MVLKEVQVRASSQRAVSDFLFEVLVGALPQPGESINVTTVSWREPGVIDHLVFNRPAGKSDTSRHAFFFVDRFLIASLFVCSQRCDI